MVFVNSMSDLFHEDVPDDYIASRRRCDAAGRLAYYQVLTKRSERMRELLVDASAHGAARPHIWWGVSVENRVRLPRIEHLQRGSAATFLSVEPLLEDFGEIDLAGINWVIVGGESGPGAGRCCGIGLCRFAASAGGTTFRFSLSSGAESERRKQVGCSTGGLMTECQWSVRQKLWTSCRGKLIS